MIGDFLGINASSSTYIIFVTLLCVAGGLLLYRLKNTIDSVALLAGNRFEQKLVLNFSRGRYIAKIILLFLGILLGQDMIKGTLIPPSYTVAFHPRKGRFLETVALSL